MRNVDDRVIDIGTPDWCWSQLATATEGSLLYRGPRGRSSLAVTYTVSDRQVIIPMAAFNDAGWQAAGSEVTLEVIGTDVDVLRWVVRATAVALRGPGPGQLAGSSLRARHPAYGLDHLPIEPTDALLLADVRIRGFYETHVTFRSGQPDVVEA